jgi:hypothetical protein
MSNTGLCKHAEVHLLDYYVIYYYIYYIAPFSTSFN